MSLLVVEMVQHVPVHTVPAVLELSPDGSLASTGEICLQRPGATVETADHIGITGPVVPEVLLQSPGELTEGIAAVDMVVLDEAFLQQCLPQDLPSQDRLDNVSPVQTVHAIGTEYPGLLTLKQILPLASDSRLEHSLQRKVGLEHVDQPGQVLPLHPGALLVEVEPDVTHLGHGQSFHQPLEYLAKHLLAALLINQVDQDLVLPVAHTLFPDEVSFHDHAVSAHFLKHRGFRGPLQIGRLLPDEGHRASSLQMDVYFLVHLDDLLSSGIIRDIAIQVTAPREEPLARTSRLSSTQQSHCDCLSIHYGGTVF